MGFDTRIATLKNEITALKTAGKKSASALAVKTIDTSLTFDLHLYTTTSSTIQAPSTKRALITLTGSDSGNFLSMLTLKSATLDRTPRCHRRVSNDGIVQFEMYTYGNTTDINTLEFGGSVTINYEISVVATSDFSLTVTYEDYNPQV